MLLSSAAIAVTLLGNVPINSLIHEPAPHEGTEEFARLQASWFPLHHLRTIASVARENPNIRSLVAIPGIGVLTSTAL